MSTITGSPTAAPRQSIESRWSIDRLLAWRPAATPELIAFSLIFVAGFALRFWDLDARAMHHDESLHATYTWYINEGRGYQHHPLMHGPLLFHLMALTYFLFGDSDATSRFVPAALGAVMVALPLLLRPWLGRVGTLAAAAFIALSPSLLYFSRFAGAGAQDIVVLCGLLLMIAGIWRYLRGGGDGWLFLTAAGLAIGFTTKEVTYMIAAIIVLYLNGAAAADLAGQRDSADSGASPWRYRARTLALMPVAWALVLFWPWLGGVRRRLRLTALPRTGDLLIVVGTLSAPMFAAAAQIPLERLGVDMKALAPLRDWRLPAIDLTAGPPFLDFSMGMPFYDWTNEKLWGALTIGALMALALYFGVSWRPKQWLICAALFWGASIVLFTTVFTNPEGVASGIWGSLDYWLEQQHVQRGGQPAWYYLVITPAYEFLVLVPALAGALYVAYRGGRDTLVAAGLAIVAAVTGALFGDAAHRTLPFVIVAMLAATYAMRARPFQQFVMFFLWAMFIGLSAAGEKMPWLETYIALPLALLAALAIEDAARAVRSLAVPDWAPPALGAAALGIVAAMLALIADSAGWAAPALALLLVIGFGGALALAVRGRAVAGLVALALLLGFLGPLSVRTAVIAAFRHGDIPVEMLVYTQTTPELARIKDEIDRYARESGQGYNLPIMVDSTEAFTWPWAWYLRDYPRAAFPDFASYRTNPALLSSVPPGAVLLAQLGNADIGQLAPGYGPGVRYKHRAWYPEEDYRALTTDKFLGWLKDPAQWREWGNFYLHKVPLSMSGSIDAMAFFPAGWTPALGPAPVSSAPLEPRLEQDGRLVAGAAGTTPGRLQRPAGLAIDAAGNVYVADSLNNRLQVFDRDGRFIATAGGALDLREPWGVAVDRAGNIYVADTWNHRVVKYDQRYTLVTTWGSPPRQPGAGNPTPQELYGPRSIAIDAAGNLLVTDTGHSRVLRFSPNGDPLGAFGGPGAGPGQFQEPVGVAVAPGGDILVTDAWNGRIQRFDAAFNFKSEYRVDGWGDRNVENKPFIAVTADGTVYAGVPDLSVVVRFAADGRPLAPLRLPGTADLPFRPLGLAADPAGDLWVADGAGGAIVRLPPP